MFLNCLVAFVDCLSFQFATFRFSCAVGWVGFEFLGRNGRLTAARHFVSDRGLIGSLPETRPPLLSVVELVPFTLHFPLSSLTERSLE
eukprot:1193394-Pleurochrysis_carterae.AAC.1